MLGSTTIPADFELTKTAGIASWAARVGARVFGSGGQAAAAAASGTAKRGLTAAAKPSAWGHAWNVIGGLTGASDIYDGVSNIYNGNYGKGLLHLALGIPFLKPLSLGLKAGRLGLKGVSALSAAGKLGALGGKLGTRGAAAGAALDKVVAPAAKHLGNAVGSLGSAVGTAVAPLARTKAVRSLGGWKAQTGLIAGSIAMGGEGGAEQSQPQEQQQQQQWQAPVPQPQAAPGGYGHADPNGPGWIHPDGHKSPMWMAPGMYSVDHGGQGSGSGGAPAGAGAQRGSIGGSLGAYGW